MLYSAKVEILYKPFMSHTNNRMQRHWEEVASYIKSEWSQIGDVELARINGDFDKFIFYLKEYYGNFPFNEALARGKLQKILNDLDNKHPERIVTSF